MSCKIENLELAALCVVYEIPMISAGIIIRGKRQAKAILTSGIGLCGVARVPGELGIDVPRQKFFDAVDRMFRDARQHIAKIALRLDAV